MSYQFFVSYPSFRLANHYEDLVGKKHEKVPKVGDETKDGDLEIPKVEENIPQSDDNETKDGKAHKKHKARKTLNKDDVNNSSNQAKSIKIDGTKQNVPIVVFILLSIL